MRPNVMTETPFQARLLERLLREHRLPAHAVHHGGRKTGAVMRGSTILGTWNQPVAVVVDADSVEPENVWEQESNYRFLLPAGNFPGMPAEVLMAVPQVEAVLFGDPEALECVLGRPLTERERIEGEFRPRAVLDRLLADAGMDRDAFLARINPRAAASFAAHPLVRSLARFIRDASAALALADAA